MLQETGLFVYILLLLTSQGQNYDPAQSMQGHSLMLIVFNRRPKSRQKQESEDIVASSLSPTKTDRYVGIHKPFLLIFASAHLLGTVCQVSSELLRVVSPLC